MSGWVMSHRCVCGEGGREGDGGSEGVWMSGWVMSHRCVCGEGEREEEGREGRGWRERGSGSEWLKSTLASLCRILSATGKLGSSPAIAVAEHRGL